MEENKINNEEIITADIIKDILIEHFKNSTHLETIDIGSSGGIKGEFKWLYSLCSSQNFLYLEYEEKFMDDNITNCVRGDICNCPEIPDNSFDIVFINHVLEHTQDPWAAAEECARICKKDGVVIAQSPFAWHYHQHPVDYWRFTHKGLEKLFSKNFETLTCGFKDFFWNTKVRMPKTRGISSFYLGKKK